MRHNFFIVANPSAGLGGSARVDQVAAALRQAGASVTCTRSGDIEFGAPRGARGGIERTL